jgi:iron complex outermembrane receptor protein
VNTLFGSAEGEYNPGGKWLFTAGVSLHRHFVRSEDRSVVTQDGGADVHGYDQARTELSGLVSAKWRPVDRLGLSIVLREEMFGTESAPVIPAFFADWLLSKRGNIIIKGSVSRNFRFPTLNDLYFQPGGNPNLKKESGFTYDLGAEFTVEREEVYKLHGEVSWFDSRIDDWIAWLPTFKGFWSPANIRRVHAYGVELTGALDASLGRDWLLNLGGNFSWTPSVNLGDPVSPNDFSRGKQLPYVPEFSSSIAGRLTFRTWSFDYKWCWYSERFTTSTNDTSTLIGRVQPYFMSDVSLEKRLEFRWADLSVKCAVRNLFDEEYESVLSHPMPGINFELFIGITPKW